MDRVGANFARSVEMMRERLGANPLVIQLPIGAEHTFAGIIDLVRMSAIRWHEDDFGQTFDLEEIPSELAAEATEMREMLIDTVAAEG